MSKRDDAIEPLLTPKEVAKIFKTSVKTVHRRIKSRALAAVQDDGLVRIEPAEVRRYIAAHRHS